MIRLRTLAVLAGLFSSGFLLAQNTSAPRSSASAYPASKVEAQYSIGAKVLSKTQVQNTFATPLTGRYVVVEVGFYPADGKIVDLQRGAFSLHSSDGKNVVGPAGPEEIASILQKRPQGDHDVTLYPTANVGYESYPVYDGTGTHRVGGPVYGAGMGVGIGSATPSATTPSDRKAMETELRDKELKQGDVSTAVAGYLYFPVSGKNKSDYQLEYRGPEAVSLLTLPQP